MTKGQVPLDPFEATSDPQWIVREEGYDPLREASFESRFTISNGFLGVRGARSVSRGERWVVPPRTYVAGLFDTQAAPGSVPELVPAADWLRVCISTPEGPVAHAPDEVLGHTVTLDMRRGVLVSDCRHMSSSGLALRLQTLRLVSLSERAIGLQLVRLEVERGEVDISLEAAFEGIHLGLVPVRLEQDLGVWRTRRSGKAVAIAAAARLLVDGQDLPLEVFDPLNWGWSWKARPGQVALLERVVAVTRNDSAAAESGTAARGALAAACGAGWRAVVDDHEAAWRERWRCSDVEIEGDAGAQTAIRFATYHLNSAANPADDRVSIGARALTGDDYFGHVFWDTEIFLLPFYIFTWPEAARALLTYRHRTLGGARAKAAAMGFRGALYAWESADTGAETTPHQLVAPDRKVVKILTGVQEQHISADVAYAVWQYWQATGDEAFLRDAGAEILLETGRFWASRAKEEADGLHHIRGVIGPDEYHQGVDDNAYTNVMARWNIACALEVAELLRQNWPARWGSLSATLHLDEAELKQWRNVADTLVTGLDARTGLFEQFQGYFGLEEIDLSTYAGRSVPMDVVLGRERTAKSQVVKQADVVALLALLPEAFTPQSRIDNFSYYEPRCSHGSSLSRAMHGLVAARLGKSEMALRYFRQTAAIDLADTHAAIAGGVHIAAQGGLWQTAVLGFAGLTIRGGDLAVAPQLPDAWESLQFPIQWRGRHLRLNLRRDSGVLEITLESGAPMPIWVEDQRHLISMDSELRLSFAAERSSGLPRPDTESTPSLSATGRS